MLYPVALNGKYGFIDEKGLLAIQPQFESAMFSSEGMAGVKRKGKWGYVDQSGNLAIPCKYATCHPFSSGLALVQQGNLNLYITSEGRTAIRCDYYQCEAFEGDLARIQRDMRSHVEFMDRNGKIALSGRNFFVSHVSQGLINCPQGDSLRDMWGYINTAGEFVIPPQFTAARPFCEGLAAVGLNRKGARRGRFSFIDTQGELAIEGDYQGADVQFRESRCAVWDKAFGFIDRHGNRTIDCRYYYADHFSEGLAVVQEKESAPYGYVDLGGRVIIKPAFAHASAFRGNLASVIIGEGIATDPMGYIDCQGRYVWKPSR
jgi:hypothetical protein